ncbi:hypothetical protein [Roseibium sediminicola]|uniref:Uncharacterized protein n=1 Tax=Roseibium sediminicola TaxID=2933272 RepID=A0ABT0H050_9HYPH|nr:hypothetical protein [Roseibium sp. CAU 1639]MCK7615069.1 hypothetical protein [Roseibium sp. CAU 1639]
MRFLHLGCVSLSADTRKIGALLIWLISQKISTVSAAFQFIAIAKQKSGAEDLGLQTRQFTEQ